MITFIIVLAVMALLPFIIYVVVKTGTYGFFQGRQYYFDNQEKDDGKRKD